MIDLLLQIIAAQAGLRPLEHPALFNDLLDDAPPRAAVFVCDELGFTLDIMPTSSLRDIEDYWWER